VPNARAAERRDFAVSTIKGMPVSVAESPPTIAERSVDA
jgi:hypothetical protein